MESHFLNGVEYHVYPHVAYGHEIAVGEAKNKMWLEKVYIEGLAGTILRGVYIKDDMINFIELPTSDVSVIDIIGMGNYQTHIDYILAKKYSLIPMFGIM